MVSTSTKLALNKRALRRKSVSTRRNEAFDKKSVSTSWRRIFYRIFGIEKIEENWFTPNFKNYIHQHRIAPNKSTKFLIDRKSVFASQNEGSLEKFDFTGPKSYFH